MNTALLTTAKMGRPWIARISPGLGSSRIGLVLFSKKGLRVQSNPMRAPQNDSIRREMEFFLGFRVMVSVFMIKGVFAGLRPDTVRFANMTYNIAYCIPNSVLPSENCLCINITSSFI